MPYRLVFMGTPDFAATVLSHVLRWDGGQVVGVYSQPDRPCGRGQMCQPTPVKALAIEHGLPVFQPETFKQGAGDEAYEELKALEPDFLLVAAYGLILPQRVLDIPKVAPLNVHGSLLPAYRGAAPIQRAVLDGLSVTGNTIMRMTLGMDEGPMVAQRALKIGPDETAGDLHDQLADMGGRLLVEVLEQYTADGIHEIPQDDTLATHAAKFVKADGELDWNQPAKAIHNRIRAVTPWPGAFFTWERPEGKPVRLTLGVGKVGPDKPEGVEPGAVLGLVDGKLAIAAADKLYLLSEIKPAGKKAMDARAFACGYLGQCVDAT